MLRLAAALAALAPSAPALQIVTDRPDPLDLPLPAQEDAFLFAIFGDRTGGPAEGIAVLADAVRDVNLIEPDLVMTVGDLVQGYNQADAWLAQSAEFHAVMDDLACPWFPVAGNHDVYWRGPDRPPEEHEGRYEAHFGPLWYAFEHKGAWFVVLYTDEPDPETGVRDFDRPASQRMGPEQLAWLETTLARAAGAEHVFVFVHHPRWLGGNYGDDWERVHRVLADAGNVTAVFGGHVHRMTYSGPRDGVEYFSLATVGGVQEGHAPSAGWLHQYHLVTVRDDRVAVASYPVGAALDPRAITVEVSDACRTLDRSLRPAFTAAPRLVAGGAVEGALALDLTNPAPGPIDVSLSLGSPDAAWWCVPDHVHARLEAGETRSFAFHALRDGDGVDAAFQLPVLTVGAEYLTDTARYPVPERAHAVPLAVDALPAPPEADAERVLALDGRDDAVLVPSAALPLPQGAFTLECWFGADAYRARQGLVAKTESSDYGLFVSDGKPGFYAFLGDAYAVALAPEPVLEVGAAHHLAGVFDGERVRLYLDGALVASAAAAGERRTNALPLVVGADVDRGGRATSHHAGWIDEVRLSSVPRYAGAAFAPARRHAPDAHTLLLLRMDGDVGPWSYDTSDAGAHGLREGGARTRPLADLAPEPTPAGSR